MLMAEWINILYNKFNKKGVYSPFSRSWVKNGDNFSSILPEFNRFCYLIKMGVFLDVKIDQILGSKNIKMAIVS